MALDNVLGVGAASHGNLLLLLFRSGLSIPFIVFTSNLLSMLMDRYPVIIYIGAAILWKVSGEMIITDTVIASLIAPPRPINYLVEGIFAFGVIIAGKMWLGRIIMREERTEPLGAGIALRERPKGQSSSFCVLRFHVV